MATKEKVVLKRSLFIGLGGTGATALLHTKKRFLDTYGEVPPMIDFLVIDTDQNTNTKTLERDNVLPEVHKETGKNVGFKKSEILYTHVKGAMETYRLHKNKLFSWMPEENEHVLRDMDHGAGQVRTNGRYSIYFNQNDIISSVKNKINDITNISIIDGSIFKPKGNGIEINFVFSVAGGTGSGSFLDVAYLVKDALAGNQGVTTIGFLVLPDVFKAMQDGISMESTNSNSYGALMDLDYLMRNDVERLGLNINFDNRNISINSNPFDILFTVNNKNTSGDTISHISDISEQIGLAMFTGASELSASVGSVYDNVKSMLAGGNLDIEDKRAWACGMGVSELFYDGNTLGNIYARRVSVTMIDNLLNTNDQAQKLANDFIDNPAVSIRENNGVDNIIDSLLQSRPNNQFSQVDDIENLRNAIQSYLNNVEASAKETITANYDTKISTVQNSLQNAVNTIINATYGVGNSQAFLTDLKNQLEIFHDEMEVEEVNYKVSKDHLEQQINDNVFQIQKLTKGIASFLKKGELNNQKSSLSDLVNQQAINIHELYRRDYAKDFIKVILSDVDKHITNIYTVEQRLKNVQRSSLGTANNLANSASEKNKIFVIDLHKQDLDNAYAAEDDFIMSDLISTLNLTNNIYDFYGLGEDTISNYFWNYTKKLRKALEYRNKSIDEVLSNFSEEKKSEIAQQLINKSQALWQWGSKGYRVGHEIFDYFVIGLPSLDSKFKESFEGLTQAGHSNIEFVNTGVGNKVTCYRMEAAVPIFGVQGVIDYESEYRQKRKNLNSINYHIDNNWLTKMTNENFSIWPEIKEDNNLSMWIFGFVYGLIKLNKNGKYEIYSLKKGNALLGYQLELSEYRNEAFDIFKAGEYALEVQALVEKKQSADGEDKTKEIMQSVKEDYINSFAQLNITIEEMMKSPNKSVADLVTREIDFTTKELE